MSSLSQLINIAQHLLVKQPSKTNVTLKWIGLSVSAIAALCLVILIHLILLNYTTSSVAWIITILTACIIIGTLSYFAYRMHQRAQQNTLQDIVVNNYQDLGHSILKGISNLDRKMMIKVALGIGGLLITSRLFRRYFFKFIKLWF